MIKQTNGGGQTNNFLKTDVPCRRGSTFFYRCSAADFSVFFAIF
jgi:hypothetical protein